MSLQRRLPSKVPPPRRPMILIHQLLPQVALSQTNVNNIKHSQNIPQNEVACTIEQTSHQQNNSPSSPPLEPHLLPITNLEPVPHYGPLRYHPSLSSNVLTNAVRWDNYKSLFRRLGILSHFESPQRISSFMRIIVHLRLRVRTSGRLTSPRQRSIIRKTFLHSQSRKTRRMLIRL